MRSGQKEDPAARAEKYSSKFFSCPQPDLRAAMGTAGLLTKDLLIADGKLHRCHIEGDKPGTMNGWYVLYGDGLLAGAFGCWKRQISETWCAKSHQEMTAGERTKFKRRMDAARREREIEERERRRVARNKALLIWESSLPAPDHHPYLVKKGTKSYGLRLYKGCLIIPLRDSAGLLHSLQFIDADGNKRFLSGGRKKDCYFLIGTPASQLCIAEGYSTSASIHEATGFSVAVAFDAGNLKSVALTLRDKFSNVEIILCADNDEHTLGNPGLTRAQEAAAAIGALLAVPPCAGDFNDLMQGTLLK